MPNHTRVIALNILVATTEAHQVTINMGDPERNDTVIDLIRGDLGFFTFRSPETRLLAIRRTFHPEAVWFDCNGMISQGHGEILARSGYMLERLPGVVYRLRGKPSICQNLVTQPWEAIPEGTENEYQQSPLVTGREVVLVENRMIKTLWTCVDWWNTEKIPVLP